MPGSPAALYRFGVRDRKVESTGDGLGDVVATEIDRADELQESAMVNDHHGEPGADRDDGLGAAAKLGS